jgi:hypothetical protein
MSNRNAKIQVKHSGVIGSIPSSTFLEFGELALNYADDKIYYKDSTGAIKAYGIAASGTTLAGDVTGPATSNTILNTVVTGKTLTNYSSTTGTISTGDTILSAIGKLNGNMALKAPIASPTFTTSIGLQYNGSTNRLNLANDATVQWLRDDSGSVQRTDTLSPATVTTGNRIWTLPSTSGTLATTAYVDALAQGLHVHASAHVILRTSLESRGAGTVTYTAGTAGVGAKLTTSNALTVAMLNDDADVLTVGARIIVAGQTNTAHNGVYTYSTSTELIRATDFDEPVETAGGDFIFVSHGSTFADTGWVLTEAVTTIDGIDTPGSRFLFTKFSGAGTFTAGNGLTLVGGTDFNVNSTTLTVDADAVDLASGIVFPSTYRSVTVDTYGRVTTGTNPTTLAGYGIEDAVSNNAPILPISGPITFTGANNGNIYHVSGTTTLTLPAASAVSDGWSIGIVNIGGLTLTLRKSQAGGNTDTINGTTTPFNNTIAYSAIYLYKSSSSTFVAIGILY